MSSQMSSSTKTQLLGLSTFIFFTINYIRLCYQDNDNDKTTTIWNELQSIMVSLNKMIEEKVNNNDNRYIKLLKDVSVLLKKTPIKEIKSLYRTINGISLFTTPDKDKSSILPPSSSSSSTTSTPSLSIDDVNFGSLLKSEKKSANNSVNATVDIIENLEYLVNEINDKNFNNVEKYIEKISSSPKPLNVNEINKESIEQDLLLNGLSPHREVETIFSFDDDDVATSILDTSIVSKIRTPLRVNSSLLPSPIDISTVKTNKSRKSHYIASKNSSSCPNTPDSVLSELTLNQSIRQESNQPNELMTPCSARSEFSESKIIGFSAIKQLPMELMDYSIDSDWGQGSDVEEEEVKPIRSSTMTKITRTTKATALTGPTPIQFNNHINNKGYNTTCENNENININVGLR